MSSAPRAFIIHLERAANRKPNVDALRARLPIESEILPAIDGRSLSPAAVGAAYVRARFSPRYPFDLSLAEIGAFLSHRGAWRRIVAENLDFGFVFEDDAAIDPDQFSSILEFVTTERPRWDYVLMPAAGLEPSGAVVVVRSDGRTLLLPHAPPLRAIGQVVSRAAAEQLLQVTAPFDRPVDTFLQMAWITGVMLLVATPTPIRDVSRDSGGTTVQRKRMGLLPRLRHEAMRPVYRAQILARYRRHLVSMGDTKA